MVDERSRKAIETSDRFADETETKDTLAYWQTEAQAVEKELTAVCYELADALGDNYWMTRRRAYAAQAARLAASTRKRDLAKASYPCGVASSSELDEMVIQSNLLRDIFGHPFRPVIFSPPWRTSTALALAHSMYDSRDFTTMPVLADALEEAGCDSTDVLDHCRGPGPHVRGCWVVDLALGKS